MWTPWSWGYCKVFTWDYVLEVKRLQVMNHPMKIRMICENMWKHMCDIPAHWEPLLWKGEQLIRAGNEEIFENPEVLVYRSFGTHVHIQMLCARTCVYHVFGSIGYIYKSYEFNTHVFFDSPRRSEKVGFLKKYGKCLDSCKNHQSGGRTLRISTRGGLQVQLCPGSQMVKSALPKNVGPLLVPNRFKQSVVVK